MSSGASRIKRGAVNGTGSAITCDVVGFQPKSVKVFNVTGDCTAIWLEGMADDSMQKVVDSGSGTTDISLVTSAGITPNAEGFVLGADTDLNVSAELIRWECSD